MSKRINDEERIFAILLILALLFCPSPAEEELRGVKQKNMLIRVDILYLKYNLSTIKLTINKKKK